MRSEAKAGGIPDPRHYGAGDHALLRLANSELRDALRDALANGRDEEIAAALRAAPSQQTYAKLWRAVCEVAHQSGSGPGATAIVARIFALPLVIVTGSARPASLPGVIPDIAALKTLFEQHGVLGKTVNFGLGNALCSLATLEQVMPSEVYAWTQASGTAPRELAPSPCGIAEAGEKVHLRFLVGAAIASVSEPSIVETASNIGAWGMPVTRALAAQLDQPGVEVLPLPRPPLELLRAAHAGRVAQLETAFDLFVSNAVRRFRAATGDPVAVIGAHDDAGIRVRLSSPFDDAMVDEFRWPLHPLDDAGRITASMAGLLEECRVTDLRFAPEILPALDTQA